jgi:hypothetical protein
MGYSNFDEFLVLSFVNGTDVPDCHCKNYEGSEFPFFAGMEGLTVESLENYLHL